MWLFLHCSSISFYGIARSYKTRINDLKHNEIEIIGTMKNTTERKGYKTDLNLPIVNRDCSTVARKICHASDRPTSKSTINILYEESLSILCRPLFLWMIVIFCSTGVYNGERSIPLNCASTRGAKVQLNCSTDDPYNGYWKYAKPLHREERIYDGDKVVNGFINLYSVDDSVKGHFNLFFNASESTSGRYVCQPDAKTGDQSAEVILLDAWPNCSETVASDVLNATCSIDFSGNWAPLLEWRIMNETLEANDAITIQSRRVTSFLSVSLDQFGPGSLNILTCSLEFKIEGKPQETSATNVPEYPNSCRLTMGSSTVDPTTQPTSPPSPSPSSSLYTVIGICVGVSIGVVAILVLVVMLYKRGMCKRKPKTKNHPEDVPMTKKA